MIAQRDAIVITMRRAAATVATTSTMKANRLTTTLPLHGRSQPKGATRDLPFKPFDESSTLARRDISRGDGRKVEDIDQ